MYKVIRFFTDLQDNRHPYNVGDVYPREGATVSQKRLDELSSNKNRQKTPLIKFVGEAKEISRPVEKAPQRTPEEPIEVSQPKRKRSKKSDVE